MVRLSKALVLCGNHLILVESDEVFYNSKDSCDINNAENHFRAENGPNCIVFGTVDGFPDRCSLQWLLDVDLKGWIPKYVLEQALINVITDFLASIKTYSVALRNMDAPTPAAPQVDT